MNIIELYNNVVQDGKNAAKRFFEYPRGNSTTVVTKFSPGDCVCVPRLGVEEIQEVLIASPYDGGVFISYLIHDPVFGSEPMFGDESVFTSADNNPHPIKLVFRYHSSQPVLFHGLEAVVVCRYSDGVHKWYDVACQGAIVRGLEESELLPVGLEHCEGRWM